MRYCHKCGDAAFNGLQPGWCDTAFMYCRILQRNVKIAPAEAIKLTDVKQIAVPKDCPRKDDATIEFPYAQGCHPLNRVPPPGELAEKPPQKQGRVKK